MTTVTKRNAPPRTNGFDLGMLPADVETIRDTVTAAFEIRLSGNERPLMNNTTLALIGQLEMLLGEDLGFDTNLIVRGLYQAAYQLLELNRRPTAEATTFGAWEYMRDAAGLTRRLVDVYAELHSEV